jgi:predicted  nucleic acid-binding Zn-ribbon protein
MPRLSPLAFDRPMPVPEDPEEGGLPSDDSSDQSHIKLGAAWLCATLAGVSALAYSSISQFSPTTTMVVLVVLLVAYAGYGYFVPKKNAVQFADSLYYMGFLWALFALIAAFVIWPVPKLTTDAVLTTFGYALVTTFCGMLLRLVMIQFQDTHPDRLGRAQETIDRRVAALTQQIDEATMEITSFRDRAASDLGAMHHDLMQSLVDVRERISEEYQKLTAMMSAGFESSLQDVLGRLAAIQFPQEILSAEVSKLVAALGKQGGDFEKAAHRLEKSLMQAAETVTSFGDSLHGSEAAKQVGVAINELSGKIKERTEEFVEMTTALEKSRTELDNQLNSLQSLGSAASMISTQLSGFEAELRDLSSASMSAEVKNGLMNVQKAIRSSLEAGKAIESTMRDVLFFMRERVTEEHSGGRH